MFIELEQFMYRRVVNRIQLYTVVVIISRFLYPQKQGWISQRIYMLLQVHKYSTIAYICGFSENPADLCHT
jgi:hypothetical protein